MQALYQPKYLRHRRGEEGRLNVGERRRGTRSKWYHRSGNRGKRNHGPLILSAGVIIAVNIRCRKLRPLSTLPHNQRPVAALKLIRIVDKTKYSPTPSSCWHKPKSGRSVGLGSFSSFAGLGSGRGGRWGGSEWGVLCRVLLIWRRQMEEH